MPTVAGRLGRNLRGAGLAGWTMAHLTDSRMRGANCAPLRVGEEPGQRLGLVGATEGLRWGQGQSTESSWVFPMHWNPQAAGVTGRSRWGQRSRGATTFPSWCPLSDIPVSICGQTVQSYSTGWVQNLPGPLMPGLPGKPPPLQGTGRQHRNDHVHREDPRTQEGPRTQRGPMNSRQGRPFRDPAVRRQCSWKCRTTVRGDSTKD